MPGVHGVLVSSSMQGKEGKCVVEAYDILNQVMRHSLLLICKFFDEKKPVGDVVPEGGKIETDIEGVAPSSCPLTSRKLLP